MPFPAPDDARSELDALITAVPSLSGKSTTKFNDINDWFASGTGEPDVYTVYSSKAGNLKVRLEQSRDQSAIGVALVPEHDLAKSVRAGRKLVGPGRQCSRALVLCSQVGANPWTVTTVIRSDDEDATREIERAFPDAEVVEPLADLGGVAGEAPTSENAMPADLDELADGLLVDRMWLREVVWLLRDKGGVVFYGPPGTGKTYIALQLARFLQPDARLRRFVQLHPSYGYEDFFEGYRPSAAKEAGGLYLAKQPGPLRSLTSAEAEADAERFLVLDEMNRGNLPRVFGELYMALEYRDQPVTLMYSPGEDFKLPRALRILGTMNTSDRSIALLDQALRRRFHFVPLFPGDPVVDGILERYLAKHHPDLAWLADVVAEANDLLDDRNMAIGPSHFMRADLDETILARVWRHSVLPTIEEMFFGNPDRVKDFELETLRTSVTSAQDDLDDDEDADDE